LETELNPKVIRGKEKNSVVSNPNPNPNRENRSKIRIKETEREKEGEEGGSAHLAVEHAGAHREKKDRPKGARLAGI
jgi:hypothetical protein